MTPKSIERRTLIRSLLFVPGNRPDMLGKATGMRPSAFVPDMEDAVPPAEKERARHTIAEKLPALAATGRLVIPRVNSIESGLLEDDVAAIAGPNIDAISIGKIRSPRDIQHVDAILTRAESSARIPAGSIGILPWIETAAAIVAVYEIASSSPRIRWIAFGADDFTADMEIPRPAPGIPTDIPSGSQDDLKERRPAEPGLIYPRSAVAIAARAAGAQALDTPYVAYRDQEGLLAEATLARKLGYTGKCAIHPAQIEPIESVFAPTDDEIEYARRVLNAWDEATARGSGATSLDGILIDTPVVERARRLLDSPRQGNTR